MSVIVARALPDVRDGLKPGIAEFFMVCTILAWHIQADIKSQQESWESFGKYHPTAILPSMILWFEWFRIFLCVIRLSWPRVTLVLLTVIRSGNAYTEARLAEFLKRCFEISTKNTVDFVPNFDDLCKIQLLWPCTCRIF